MQLVKYFLGFHILKGLVDQGNSGVCKVVGGRLSKGFESGIAKFVTSIEAYLDISKQVT